MKYRVHAVGRLDVGDVAVCVSNRCVGNSLFECIVFPFYKGISFLWKSGGGAANDGAVAAALGEEGGLGEAVAAAALAAYENEHNIIVKPFNNIIKFIVILELFCLFIARCVYYCVNQPGESASNRSKFFTQSTLLMN